MQNEIKKPQPETQERKQEILNLSGKEIEIGNIIKSHDKSPKTVMHGEVAIQEEVWIAITINGDEYIATLHRSDYNENAPSDYVISLTNDMVTLKDARGTTYILSREDNLVLIRKIEETHKNLA